MFWPSDVFWITLKGLQEFKWYIVRVAAGNLMGLGPYSDMLVFNHTLEGGEKRLLNAFATITECICEIMFTWRA